MSYFKKFPLTEYELDHENYLVVNVTKEVNSSFVFDDPMYYLEYNIQDGDTPIILADKLYGDPDLAWTILLFNKIVSPFEDWPLDYTSLINYTEDKYDDVYAIHHYKSLDTDVVVDSDFPSYNRYPVTNFEHETNVNDSKKKIKIITSDFISEYVESHNNKVQVEI
jgi:hypothetical protein